jgi:hypothetical protein
VSAACPSCGQSFRTGVTVLLVDPRLPAERKRVCRRCASKALRICAPYQGPIVKAAPAPRSDDVERAIRMLTTYAKAANAAAATAARGIEHEFQRGRAEGFEGAIELLRGPK